MMARGSGAIVNLTSLAAHNGGGPGARPQPPGGGATLAKAWARGWLARVREMPSLGPSGNCSTSPSPARSSGHRQTIPLRRARRPGGRRGHRLPGGRGLGVSCRRDCEVNGGCSRDAHPTVAADHR
jgi:hypothetical protein